jgi:multidrug resistance efflux pump
MLRKRAYWGLGLAGGVLVVVAVVAVTAGALFRDQSRTALARATGANSSDSGDGALPVHVIRPKCDPCFALSVKAPAQVAPYEWSDLEAQVAGRVESIRKAEGSRVKTDELLLKIAVPDLEDAVKEKEAIIRQRKADLKLAEANEKIAGAAVTVADKDIKVKEAEVETARAMENFRTRESARFKQLIADNAATGQLVEEREFYSRAATADVGRARAAVEKAKADWLAAKAKLGAAGADIKLKQELIDVAQRDRDRAQELVEYSKITAPYDGIITHRYVNRGSFVQNATTGHTDPLLRVERRDIITVEMKVPDTFAPFVDNDTEAVIEMSKLPGQAIHGKVTRKSDTLETHNNDHTMLVWVDLYNGTEEEYNAFLAKERATGNADLKDGPLPLMPKVTATDGVRRPLLPGYYGEMTLIFRKLPNTYLLPSDAIIHQGGAPYIYLVRDGKARLVPIEVQVDDQKLAKVAILSKTANGTVKRPLTGDEQVIYSNQSELTDGQAVEPIAVDWATQD